MRGTLTRLGKNGQELQTFVVASLHAKIGSDIHCDIRIKHKDVPPYLCLITAPQNKPVSILP